jgi:plasmid stabilization system protein ParE
VTVRYTRRAQRDLAEILDDIDRESPQGARNVKRALERAIQTIEQFPRCGYSAGRGAAHGLAVTPYPYIVYWIIEGDDAQIIHIRHGARRPWTDKV